MRSVVYLDWCTAIAIRLLNHREIYLNVNVNMRVQNKKYNGCD